MQKGKLYERFGYPPFSVLDARSGPWGNRKKLWRSLGLHGEEGREGKCGMIVNTIGFKKMRTTSVFDPVLCELMYLWFCPPGGKILDPFAGEATKGIVAGLYGYDYTGVELRQEQVNANLRQAGTFKVSPRWVVGDSGKLENLLPNQERYDFVWTSPPYYDLEVYSKDERDGSAKQTYEDFMAWYEGIFRQAVRRLRNNRFLAVKVGEIRDKRGFYRGFVPDNIALFRRLGLTFYNEVILLTPLGTLQVRVAKPFMVNRKLGKCHQNILIFYKGDVKSIRNNYPREVKLYDLATLSR